MKKITSFTFTYLLILLWTIFIISLYGFFHGGSPLLSPQSPPEPPTPPEQPEHHTNQFPGYIVQFTEVVLYLSYIPVGIIYGAIMGKFKNKILISTVVCALQIPTILGLGLLSGIFDSLSIISFWRGEPYSLAMTFTVFTVWGFFFGVTISEFLRKKIKMKSKDNKISIGIGILALLAVMGIIYLVLHTGIQTPTDSRIVYTLQENEENLLSINGVIGAGIARNESNNHIIGIAVYVEDAADTQRIPSKLGEFEVFIKKVSETPEAEEKKMIIYRFYPAEVRNIIFDDSEKIQNTASFLIQTHEPIINLNGKKVQTLRNSGVRVLKDSDIPTVYHSLIEEDKVDEVRNLDFVKTVYPYKTK